MHHTSFLPHNFVEIGRSNLMAYAGYVPAKLPPGKPTEFQAALWSIKSNDTLEVIQKLSYNTAIAPTDDKFRKVHTTRLGFCWPVHQCVVLLQ